MIRLKFMRLRLRRNGLPKYYLIAVKLILFCGLLCFLVQPFVYSPIHYTVTSYWVVNKPTQTIPGEVIRLVSEENASRLLDEEIDGFRAKNRTRIPKILHQIYADEMIPDVYVPFIKSWVEHHPDYEYWLWDDVSARLLVERHYPKFLPLYDAYCHDLFRSDVTRYFLLHKFGGMYMDMDYVSYKNMDPLLSEKQCLVVEENRAQSRMIYRVPDIVMNAWMASVPGHPYLQYLINLLPSTASCYFHDVLASTGPLFIYKARKQYIQITRCNLLEGCYVHILPCSQMMNSWDPDTIRVAKKHCRNNATLSALQLESCQIFESSGYSVEPAPPGNAFADHLFLHLGNLAKNYHAREKVNIKDIVPHAIIPSQGKL